MIEELVIYPDPLLRKKSEEVLEFGSALGEIFDNMYETMIDKNGVGLAAVQVGRLMRMLIANPPREDKTQNKEDLIEVVNPRIIESSGSISFQEGCLSIPNFYEYINRASHIKIAFQDREGKPHTLEAHDYLAVILQHEIDHLDGILFIDKLDMLKRKKFEKEYKKSNG